MVFDKVRKLIAEQFGISESSITLDSDIVKDFDADSLDIVDLVMRLEEEWDLIVDDDDVVQLNTVRKVVDYIESHTN